MNLWTTLSTLAGGLGLFLLGMGMMTEGLKLAAGSALERILGAATRTRAHALGSGVLITTLVQSSSATTMTTITTVTTSIPPPRRTCPDAVWSAWVWPVGSYRARRR